jgi:DNA invertase Pin-like site-specific DNA recombinase
MTSSKAAKAFIAYCRVSTARQGRSGLGLEAQREAIRQHVGAGRIVAEYVEIESGKRADNRPQLAAALAACKLHRATLVIAKLDRLSRNVAFIAAMMDSGVDFIAVDFPQANRLTLHILAAVAEHEREAISARTIAALAAAKRRGVKLGNPDLQPGTARTARIARAAHVAGSSARAQGYAAEIERARAGGAVTLQAIAAHMSAAEIPTPRGATNWTAEQVKRMLGKLAA